MRVLLSLAVLALAARAQTPALPPGYEARVADLEKARRSSPSDLRVLDALAGSYTMAADYTRAIAVIRQMLPLASGPSAQADVRLRLGRNQAWSGDTSAAIDSYEQYLKVRPQDRTAVIELIRLRRWQGDYGRAEALCNRLLARNPDDAEVLAMKAEVLHWAGHRPFAARRAAGRAVQLAPDSPDARVAHVFVLRDLGQRRAALREFNLLESQVSRRGIAPDASFGDAYRLLERDLARSVASNSPSYSVYNDSDGIRDVFAGLHLAMPFRDDHQFVLDLGHSRSSAPLGSPFTSGRDRVNVYEFSGGGNFRLGPAVHLTALAGGSRRSTGYDVRPTFDLRLTAAPLDRWTLDLEAGREFLKVTPRAIDLDISSYRVAGGLQYALDARTTLGAHAGRRYWSDHNRSQFAEGQLRRILHYYKPFMIDAGAQTRWEKFDRDTRFASGFFTPERYRRHDGFLGLHGEFGRRLSYDLRGAAGAQQLARGADYRASWEASSSFTFRLTGPLSLSANYQRRNYSLLARNGWYQGFWVSLAIRP